MMLFLSLLAIAALAVLPDLAFQVQRDREEELIHRGLGYSRGIRRFYKKFGRYPTRIEELEDTNSQRFIRKRYKDPVTGQDFKVLRMGDPQLSMLGQMPGLNLPRQQPGGPASKATVTQVTKTDTADTGSGDSDSSPGAQGETTGATSDSGDGSNSGGNSQTFGGGPMLGVVSMNKAKTIREFCSKSRYKEWLFIYDPSSDRGGALNSPWCPVLANQFGVNPTPPPTAAPSPPNTGAPGTVPSTQNVPNPGTDMPPEQ